MNIHWFILFYFGGIDPQNRHPKKPQAYWRAARASLQLDLCRNGIDFCEAGLEQAPLSEESHHGFPMVFLGSFPGMLSWLVLYLANNP